MMDIFFCLILSSFLAYFLLTSNWFKRIRLGFTIPGPPALPIIALQELSTKAYENYGPVFRVWISAIPVFFVLDPKYIQIILQSSKNTNKNFLYSLGLNFLGTGLLTINGQKWKTHRKLLQPSFKLNVLETFVDCFADHAMILVNQFRKMAEKEININAYINNYVINVLHEAILGISIENNTLNDLPFTKRTALLQERVSKPWLLFDFLFYFTKLRKIESSEKQNSASFTRQIMEQRKLERKQGLFKTERISLLDRMLEIQEENPEFTDEDIDNELSSFMLAGQESVATTISFCLYCLSNYKDIQNKVYEELYAIFADSTRLPNMDDLQAMVYLEQCIKETLRMYPTAAVFSRKLGESVQIGKHNLPEGSNIFISPYFTHRLKHVYPNPLHFDPERFSVNNLEKRAPYSFIPFSAGPRNCIGYKFAMIEMKIIISTIIRNFVLVVKPGFKLNLTFRITLRAKGGIWMTFIPRRSIDCKK